jgi:hypothetical protein
MKILISAFLSTLIFSAPADTMAQSAGDREAVTQVMQHFLDAYETGDPESMRKAFRADGVMIGYAPATRALDNVSGADFIKRFDGVAEDDPLRKRSFEILDVTETGAVTKVTLDYPTWNGVDYLALSKIDGKWMIVSKSWSGKAVPAPKQ